MFAGKIQGIPMLLKMIFGIISFIWHITKKSNYSSIHSNQKTIYFCNLFIMKD